MVTLVLLQCLLAQAEPRPQGSRFYFQDTIELGAWLTNSSYNDGAYRDTSRPGFKTAEGPSIGIESTWGGRLNASIAIGGLIQVNVMPVMGGSSDRRGEKVDGFAIPFGFSGLIAPSVIWLMNALRVAVSPGFMFLVTGPQPGKNYSHIGGAGFGLKVGGGYDLALSQTLMLALGIGLTAGFHLNSDTTHSLGWDFSPTLTVGLRRR